MITATSWADEVPPIRNGKGHVDHLAHRVLVRLARIADMNGHPRAAISEPAGLASSLGVERREVERALNALEEADLIERTVWYEGRSSNWWLAVGDLVPIARLEALESRRTDAKAAANDSRQASFRARNRKA